MLYKKTLLAMVVGILCGGGTAQAQNPRLAVDPDALFFRQVGANAPPPAPRTITVHTRGGGTLGAFTVAAATTSGGSWLSVSPNGGTGTTTLTASVVNTAGLNPGKYSGTITITVTAPGFSNSPFVVKVTFEILSTPVGPPALIVQPDELEFKVKDNAPAPPSRQVIVQSPNNDNFTWKAEVTAPTPPAVIWLKITPAAPTIVTGKGILQVSVDPTGLSNGEFKGEITVTSGTNIAKVKVELEKETTPAGPGGGQGGGQGGQGRAPKLLVTPQALNFIVEPNATKPLGTKTLEVRTTGHGNTLKWTATASVSTPTNGNWLSITPLNGSTPGSITVTATPGTLPEGMYSGKVTVKADSQEEEVRVWLRILGQSKSLVRVRPKTLQFTATPGAGGTISPTTATVSIESSKTGLTFTATASTAKGGNWLGIPAPSTSATGSIPPGTITVSLVSSVVATLAPGVYTGKIEVKVSGAAQEVHNVLVTLKVFGANDTPRLKVEPAAVSFVASQGATSNPPAKTVKLRPEGAAEIAWSATVSGATLSGGGTWLSVSPTSGKATTATPSPVNVSAAIGNLSQGNYSGTVTFASTSPTGVPPVQLRVHLIVRRAGTGPSGLSFAKLSLPEQAIAAGSLIAFFTEPADGFISQVDTPPNLSVTVLDSDGVPVEGARVVVRSSHGEPDLILEDVGGGQYEGVFRALFTGPLALIGSAEIGGQTAPAFGVSGDIESAAIPPTVIFQNGAVSAASFSPAPTPIAPGSLVSLFGLNLTTETAAASSLPLPDTLAGVRVTIGGISARLLTLAPDNGQINLQVPYELSGQSQAEIVVNNNGVLSLPETIAIGVAPALFTLSQDGLGPAAAQHDSDSSAVTASRPATAGETIRLYATGLGSVQPSVESGAAPAGLSRAVSTVTVTIGGLPAEVQFAGLAPSFVGLYQINVRVPAGVSAGDASVVVSVDGTPATGRATIAVR